MTPFLFLAIRTALNLTELQTSGEVGLLKSDLAALAEKLKALAARDDGSIPTDEELHAMIAAARKGFQAALDDEA